MKFKSVFNNYSNQRRNTLKWLKSPTSRLFVQQLVQAIKTESSKTPHHWLFVMGIHWSLVDSPHKVPVIRKVFLCQDVFMDSNQWRPSRHRYTAWDPVYSHGLTLISAEINNHMHNKVWGEIAHSFTNFNGCATEVWGLINDFNPHFIKDVITYPFWD